MKYKRWVPQALILLGIYICGLVLGCAAICCLPQYLDRAKFQDSARQAAEAFAAGGSTLVQGWSDVSVLVFDEAGELIYQRTGAAHLPWMNYEDYARGHVHRALRSGDYFGVIFVPRSREEAASGQWLGAVGVFTLFGSRFTLADGRAAVLFEVKCEMARFIIIEQFLWVYSVSMLVIACFFYISYRKWRKLGELERDYVDNITHELKSPIASIKALAMALSEHDLSQEERAFTTG